MLVPVCRYVLDKVELCWVGKGGLSLLVLIRVDLICYQKQRYSQSYRNPRSQKTGPVKVIKTLLLSVPRVVGGN